MQGCGGSCNNGQAVHGFAYASSDADSARGVIVLTFRSSTSLMQSFSSVVKDIKWTG